MPFAFAVVLVDVNLQGVAFMLGVIGDRHGGTELRRDVVVHAFDVGFLASDAERTSQTQPPRAWYWRETRSNRVVTVRLGRVRREKTRLDDLRLLVDLEEPKIASSAVDFRFHALRRESCRENQVAKNGIFRAVPLIVTTK